MSKYKKTLPTEPTFVQNGLVGRQFPLETKEIEVYSIESTIGHDRYATNKVSDHLYYVISGEGRFKVGNDLFPVSAGDFLEIPAGTEFVFAGKMNLLLIQHPGFLPENHIDGKENDLF
jgi:mannose-6-phosphate isomerase-like protein (cupin superfamily)